VSNRRNSTAVIVSEVAKAGRGLRVVIYARKSNEDKVDSIARQLEQCRAYCAANGWVVVGEYIDEDRSGSKRDVIREQFDAMVARAEQQGDYNAVVVLMHSRFTRADSIGGGSVKDRLRLAGVRLECVKEGTIDWGDPMGRMKDFMIAEGDNKVSRDISAHSVSGREGCVTGGWWPYGTIPYGYARQYYDEARQPRDIVSRRAKSSKPRTWRVKLVIDEAEAAVVRYIFDQYNTRRVSLREIADELSRAGHAAPYGGTHWSVGPLRKLIRNHVYIGFTTSGVDVAEPGEWNRMAKLAERSQPPIIDDDTLFEAVQAKLADRAAKGARERKNSDGHVSVLKGSVVCGHCGFTCVNFRQRLKRAGEFKTYSYYMCSSPTHRPSLGCKFYRADEWTLTERVLTELVTAVDGEVFKRLMTPPAEPTRNEAEAEKLRQQILDLEAEVAVGTDNLFKASPTVFELLQKRLEAKQAELTKARNTLKVITTTERPGEIRRIAKWWQTARKMGEIGELLFGERAQKPQFVDPEATRELLHKFDARVVLHWTPRGKRYFKLDYGKLKITLDPTRLGVSDKGAGRSTACC
jgi:DNA invertase Pin-like site-specific DNA recombinase